MEDKNWLSQQLHLLLTAYGYNLYAHANRARADDLLVRQRASDSLGTAVTHLSRLAADYAAKHVPPSTRENPFPPAEAMAGLKRIETLRGEISQLASEIRGMSAPTADRTWAKFRNEDVLLEDSLRRDYHLIRASTEIEQAAESLTTDSWSEDVEGQIRRNLEELGQTARARERLLLGG